MRKIALFLTMAILMLSMVSPACAEWKHDSNGWWWENDDGTKLVSEWKWIDGNDDGVAECYYFGEDGYLLRSTTTPDEKTVNSEGAWVEGDIVKEQQVNSEENTEKEGQEVQQTQDTKSYGSIEVLSEYTLPDSIGWYTRHFMVIRNNSSETLKISTSSLAYASDGTLLSLANSSFDALGAGCTSVVYEAFETGDEISYYDTSITSSKGYYESVIQDLSYKMNDISGGTIIQVTNNGDNAAEFVEGYVLFFLGDDLVGYDDAYFTDDDYEIKPGDTILKQFKIYDEFDRIEFYLDGRR